MCNVYYLDNCIVSVNADGAEVKNWYGAEGDIKGIVQLESICVCIFFYFYVCVFLYFCNFIFVYFCIFIKENAQLEWTSLSIFFNGSFNSFFCVWLLISLYLCLFQSSPTSSFCLSCFTDFAEELPHGPGPTNLMDYARDHHKETHLVTIIIICK